VKTIVYIGALATATLLAAATGLLAQAPPTDSLTLDRAIAIAIGASPAVRQAGSALEASQARTRQIHSAYYPQIEADATYRRADPTISVSLPFNGEVQEFSFFPNDNYEAALTAQQTLYDFGRARAQEDLARSGEQTARDNQEQIRTTIAFQTVQAFNTSLVMQRNLAVLDEQIAALEENLHLAEEKLKGGTATNYDVLSTQVRLTTVRNQRVDVEGSLRKQEATLRRLLGYAPSAPLRLKGSFELPLSPSIPDTLTAEALRQRSEIVLARDAATTARLQLDVARSSDSPLLSLNVTGGVKNGFPPDLNAPKLNWAGTLHLAVPIFNGFRTRAMEEEAQANLNAAEARQADLEGNIAMEVEQAVADVQTSAQKISTADLQVEQARQALALARVRYQNGVITSLELINAQTTLQEAEFQRLQYQYNYTMSRYALQKALGERIW
jgi:outer membrane protein